MARAAKPDARNKVPNVKIKVMKFFHTTLLLWGIVIGCAALLVIKSPRLLTLFKPSHLLTQSRAILQDLEKSLDSSNLFSSETTTTVSTPSPKLPSPAAFPVKPPPPKNFTESQLWQALVDYRHTHQKPDLLPDERLCVYARGRIAEHLQLFASTDKENYPKPDKYPLDAHAGFVRDGDSGYLFESTGFQAIAENLAYWPSAQYANQVIEWGWDTSTEGHREAQLTTDYTHACLTGQDGFFIALFARH